MAKKKNRLAKSVRTPGTIERIDVRLGEAAAKHRKSRLVKTTAALAAVADQPPLIAISAATLAAGLILRRPRLARTGARMLASELLATGLKALAKRYVDRTRPGKMLRDGRYALKANGKGSRDEGPWNSFPSGHSAGAAAVARAVSREYPAAGPVAALAAGGIAAVQVPSGAHFPSDVAVGGALGLVAEAVIDRVARRLRQ